MRQHHGIPRHAPVVSAAVLALAALLHGATPADEPGGSPPARFHVLLINGGKSAPSNMLSHLHHLQEMVKTLRRDGRI